jgi:hypothetical protein
VRTRLLDHCFNPPGAVETALSRASKIAVLSRAANPHRHDDDAVMLNSTLPTRSPAAAATCARAQIPIAALQSP